MLHFFIDLCCNVLFPYISEKPVSNVKSQFAPEFFINLIVIGYLNFKHEIETSTSTQRTIASRINNYINQCLVTMKDFSLRRVEALYLFFPFYLPLYNIRSILLLGTYFVLFYSW